MSSLIEQFIYSVPAVLLAICLHEYAHGYVSYLMGDPTPKVRGRLSLNPLHHLDPVGTLCLIFFHFGWAKPVMVNPNYYRHRKRGMVLVALAGPLANFILAFLSMVGMGFILKYVGNGGSSFISYLYVFLNYCVVINIGLGSFNLIPIPPLDGSKILGAILPDDKYFSYMRYERYGQIILMVLLVSDALNGPLNWMHMQITSGIWQMVKCIIGIG